MKIQNFEEGDILELPVYREGQKTLIKSYKVERVYSNLLLLKDRKGNKRTVNYGELVQNGYGPRIGNYHPELRELKNITIPIKEVKYDRY